MEKQFNLLIDTKRTGFNTVRGLKQGDNISVLDITLVQNSIPFDLTGLTVRINYKRPDNKIFLQMADVVNAAEGQVKVNVLTKVLETAGEIKSDLSVFDKDNRKITSATFNMFVEASIYGNDYIEPEDLDLIQQIYSEEEKRIRQENEREINEKTRQSNENIRIENENVRKDSELERIKNEEIRQENENIRVNKEDARITQENERVESETIRQAKEKERVENEETRQANEEKRQSDEITRQQNEENRKQTQLDMQKVITNINEIEPYEISKTYNKLNRVTYNGSSYEAVKDVPINTPPTNTMYWICIAEKGKDGKGSGNMHTDIYDKNNDGIVDVAETANNVDWSNIQNKPDLSQMSKVQSVNDKTGKVVLNAEDIKTTSGSTVETQLAEKATKNDLNAKVDKEYFNDFKTETETQLQNTKGSKSGITNTGYVTTNHLAQVNVSTHSTATEGQSQVNASEYSTASGVTSQINASEYSIASGVASQVNASRNVINDGNYSVAGGYALSDKSSKNMKWQIKSTQGTIKATGAITGNSTFADFAEYFESIDGKSIPTGTIVALEGDKIKPCDKDEEMLGVISETAGVLLNASGFCWQDRYLRNEFGGLIYEEKYDEKTKEYITIPKENPNHDMQEEYVAREDREEWNIVGLTGQVYIRIDNTVGVGDFIKSNNVGIATKNANPTWQRWKVMKVTTPYNEEKGYGVALVFIR